VSVLGGLAGAWLRQRSPTRRAAAWILAVAGPALLTLAALPLRSALVLGGFLFSALLVVIAVAVLGGPRPAVTAVGLSVLARVLFFGPPLISHRPDLRPNLVSLIGFAVAGAGVSILIGKLARLAEEQAALRRVATLVAHAAPAGELFAALTEEVGRLIAADFVRMARYDDSGNWLTSVAAWSRTGEDFPGGRRWPAAGELTRSVAQSGLAARLDDIANASGPLAVDARAHGIRSAVEVPILVEGHIWGVVLTGSTVNRAPPAGTEARLASFTDLLAAAISNAESRAGLTRLAEEQTALRRVATLVARGAPAEEVFTAVSEEAGRLLDLDQTAMIRYGPDGISTVVASWTRTGQAIPPVGDRKPLGGNNLDTIILQTRRPARVDRYADASGAPAAAAREAGYRSGAGAPIIVQGRIWGAMIASSLYKDPLPVDTEERLASFTDLVATAISNAETLAELTASRARVVAAADETRRQIERDLHDGAQQRLVSLGLALRLLQAEVPPQVGGFGDKLADLGDGLGNVIDDLREMARGIHPAILSEGGLGPALKTLARRSAVPVELDVQALARLPERVEVAAYYVISEALTNAAKHANASVIQVGVETAGPVLHLRVRDDGDGGADPSRGSGLVGLRDRVEALGGTIAVHSPAGAGTSLHADLPLPG
jgi:signal transduction histidine kinase